MAMSAEGEQTFSLLVDWGINKQNVQGILAAVARGLGVAPAASS
jgi:hypothetical protein